MGVTLFHLIKATKEYISQEQGPRVDGTNWIWLPERIKFTCRLCLGNPMDCLCIFPWVTLFWFRGSYFTTMYIVSNWWAYKSCPACMTFIYFPLSLSLVCGVRVWGSLLPFAIPFNTPSFYVYSCFLVSFWISCNIYLLPSSNKLNKNLSHIH